MKYGLGLGALKRVTLIRQFNGSYATMKNAIDDKFLRWLDEQISLITDPPISLRRGVLRQVRGEYLKRALCDDEVIMGIKAIRK